MNIKSNGKSRLIAILLWFSALTSRADSSGSLKIYLIPPTVVSNGAQWQVDGGPWQSSGSTVSGLASGMHYVSFSTVSGWVSPNAGNVSVSSGITHETIARYNPALSSTANPFLGIVPLTVAFTATDVDAFGYAITAYNWVFGDGDTSSSQNPTHTYTQTGIFDCNLVGINSLGMADAGARPYYIEVTPPPIDTGLVTNGDFETGDFTGWTTSSEDDPLYVDNGDLLFTIPNSGIYMAELGSGAIPCTVSQQLETTAGTTYLLSFSVNNAFQDPAELWVSWNGTSLLDTTNLGDGGWTNMQFTVTATGPCTALQFELEDDVDYVGFDSVSLLPVPMEIAAATASGANLKIDAYNGVSNKLYRVLMSTNLFLPVSEWTPVATNTPSANGSFSVTVSNVVTTEPGQWFYVFQQE